MCGLLAMHTISKQGFLKSDIDEFKMMLELTAFRGKHSTGIAGIDLDSTNQASIIKAVGAPHYLEGFKETGEFYDRAFSDFTTMIGHCRYATRGAIDAHNAHPYKEGNIILAHNGTIDNYHQLRDANKHGDITVDSHLIARLFATENVKETLEKVEGAFVFMWFNQEDRTFNIARNNSRPLYWSLSQGRNLLFASEKETLEWNASRNKSPATTPEIVSSGKILTWVAGQSEPTEIDFTPKVKMYPVYVPPVYEYNTSSQLYTKYDSGLIIGESITFEIADYETKYSLTTITGYAFEYPDILFKATYNYIVDDKLLREAKFIKGTVRNVSKSPSNSIEDYIAYIQPTNLMKSERVEALTIKDTSFVYRTLTRTAYNLMLRKSCPWCTSPHSIKGTVLKGVLYEVDSKAIVCMECSAKMFEYEDRRVTN
jgi:hypothetical protein